MHQQAPALGLLLAPTAAAGADSQPGCSADTVRALAEALTGMFLLGRLDFYVRVDIQLVVR